MSGNVRIAVREAEVGDAAAIAEVQVGAWKVAYRGVVPDGALEEITVAHRTERLTEILAEGAGTSLVAVLDGRVVGWSAVGASRDDDRQEEVGEVYAFYVHPDTWRSGVGRTLWNASVERLKGDGHRSADVWVLEANEPARRFYDAVGCVHDVTASKMFEWRDHALPEARYSLPLNT